MNKKAELEGLDETLTKEKQKNINKIRGTETKTLTRGGTLSIKKQPTVGSLTQPEEPASAILNVNMLGATTLN